VSDTALTDDASMVATSKVVTTVFEQILGAVHDGTLLPGQRISDAELAQQFGVSRTPVREALQRLREIGIIEASPSRFTRVADVTPLQTAQAFVVWLALYSALVEEVVPIASAQTYATMERDHADFLGHLPGLDPQALATANFLFFSRLPLESRNPALQRAIVSVVHIVRLGSLHLPAYIDVAALTEAQRLVLDAVRDRDVLKARAAMRLLRHIEVPQD
jgi:DNA-binding GntR family transcriptional regulator